MNPPNTLQPPRPRAPLPEYLKVMGLLLPLWAALVAQVYFTRRLAAAPLPPGAVLREMAPLYLSLFALTPLALWAARKCPLEARRWRLSLLQLLGFLPLFAALDHLLERTLYLAIAPSYASVPALAPCRLTFHSGSMDGLLATLGLATPFYLLILAAHYAFDYHHDIQARALRAARLEAQFSDSRLQTLKGQLQPHFLFNALNALYAHIPPEAETAQRMVVLLSSFLRRSLQEMGLQRVPLRQEVEFVSLYLEIQQLRFSNRLRVAWDVPPELLDLEVPHLILQPLVENAIKHGLAPKPGPGTIWIRAWRTSAALGLAVSDDGLGPGGRKDLAPGAGVGLANTRNRLRHLYGDGASLEFGAREGGGFQVALELPLKRSDRPRGAPVPAGEAAR